MIKNVLNILCTLLLLACFSCSSPENCESICIKEGRGVWKMSVGTPEDVTLLSLLDISPNWKAIEAVSYTHLRAHETDKDRGCWR